MKKAQIGVEAHGPEKRARFTAAARAGICLNGPAESRPDVGHHPREFKQLGRQVLGAAKCGPQFSRTQCNARRKHSGVDGKTPELGIGQAWDLLRSLDRALKCKNTKKYSESVPSSAWRC